MPLYRIVLLAASALAFTVPNAVAQDAKSSFFVTSVGKGDGANLGGLEGADAHCNSLAEAERMAFAFHLKHIFSCSNTSAS